MHLLGFDKLTNVLEIAIKFMDISESFCCHSDIRRKLDESTGFRLFMLRDGLIIKHRLEIIEHGATMITISNIRRRKLDPRPRLCTSLCYQCSDRVRNAYSSDSKMVKYLTRL